jgi:glycosyltransferase involved in cell wall biosynthesis
MTKQHKLWWQSSFDRGVQHILKMWPKIKEKFPDATLGLAYGWGLFAQRYAGNPERMQWMENMNKLMEAPGITNHGKVSKEELAKLRSKCGIWTYPTDFDEINCMAALECQASGVVPCVINKAALKETVGSGVKVEGDVYDGDCREEYLKQLLALMGDEKRWKEEQLKGIEFAKSYQWNILAQEWIKEFTAT